MRYIFDSANGNYCDCVQYTIPRYLLGRYLLLVTTNYLPAKCYLCETCLSKIWFVVINVLIHMIKGIAYLVSRNEKFVHIRWWYEILYNRQYCSPHLTRTIKLFGYKYSLLYRIDIYVYIQSVIDSLKIFLGKILFK